MIGDRDDIQPLHGGLFQYAAHGGGCIFTVCRVNVKVCDAHIIPNNMEVYPQLQI